MGEGVFQNDTLIFCNFRSEKISFLLYYPSESGGLRVARGQFNCRVILNIFLSPKSTPLNRRQLSPRFLQRPKQQLLRSPLSMSPTGAVALPARSWRSFCDYYRLVPFQQMLNCIQTILPGADAAFTGPSVAAFLQNLPLPRYGVFEHVLVLRLSTNDELMSLF